PTDRKDESGLWFPTQRSVIHFRARPPAVAPARSAASNAAPLFSSSRRDAWVISRAGRATSGTAVAGRRGDRRRKRLRAITKSGTHNSNSAAAAIKGAPTGPTSGRTNSQSAVTAQPTAEAAKAVARVPHHAAAVMRRAANPIPPADTLSAKAIAAPFIRTSM